MQGHCDIYLYLSLDFETQRQPCDVTPLMTSQGHVTRKEKQKRNNKKERRRRRRRRRRKKS